MKNNILLGPFLVAFLLILFPSIVLADDNVALEIDGNITYYETLEAAISNTVTDSDNNITLLNDVYLGSILSIKDNKKIMIKGESKYNIFRLKNTDGTWYEGRLFNISSGATLTLDGVIIDGENNWLFNLEQYEIDLKNKNKVLDVSTYVTPEVDKSDVNDNLISNNGTLNIVNSVIKNIFSSKGKSLITASAGSLTTLDDTQVIHCASYNGGLVINITGVDAKAYIEEETFIDDNYVAGNGGIFKVYNSSIVEMNGGVVSNTRSVNSNGVVAMTYGGEASFILNGGIIKNNSGVSGKNNGRNAPLYLHRSSKIIINGGTIEENYGYSTGGIDAPGYTSSSLELNGGIIQNNMTTDSNIHKSDVSVGADYDLTLGENMVVNGNIFAMGDITNNGVVNGNITVDLGNTGGISLQGTGQLNGDFFVGYTENILPTIDESFKINGRYVLYDTAVQTVFRLIYNGGTDGESMYDYKLIDMDKSSEEIPVFPLITKEGYTFNGWYKDEKLTEKWEKDIIEGYTILYAGWTPNSYSVTWQYGDKTEVVNCLYGSSLVEHEPPVREGYIFKGWEGYTEDMTMPSNNVVFVAKWEKVKEIIEVPNPETLTGIQS